jgi:diguanylate cyclase (GGDEF)-like protein
LTNIANRRSFDDVLAKQIEMWKAAGTPFCLAIADIDHFKRLNDNYGHQAGDKMLHDVARSLETTIRKTDIVARYGGEEFAIVMPNTTGQEAVEIAERVRADIEATRFFHHRAKLRLTISVGVSQVIGDDGPQAIIQRSDEALYASKQAGRNRTHLQNCEGCIPFGESDATSTDSPDRQTSTPAQAVSNSILDPITHLPKREIFLNELSRRACELERYGYEFAVGIVRLQSYDSLVALGPTALNRSLNIISELIRGVVRDPDLVVRYNSDTFAILMPATTADRGKEALNRVQTEIANCDSFRHRGKVIELRADTAVSQPQGKSATNVIGRLMSGIERLPADAECV